VRFPWHRGGIPCERLHLLRRVTAIDRYRLAGDKRGSRAGQPDYSRGMLACRIYRHGIMMLIAGVAEVVNAFQVKSWGKFFLWILLGVLYIVAGFVTFENPLLTAALLTIVLGAALVALGIMRIILAFNMKAGAPWIGVIFSGVITFLLGLIILAHWPVSSLYVLGLFLGIDLVFAGLGWIGVGIGLKAFADEAHQKAGYDAGHSEGYEASRKAGHGAGRAEGYEAGQKVGYDIGRAEGYEAGQKAGRDEAVTPPKAPPSADA
jgi:uncharacterized membrane protein HdeD (DUF308 family)